jgi:nicotinamidase-related amidase
MARIWDDVVGEEDRRIYALGGLGQRAGLGQRPALLVVDITHEFTGDRPEARELSIERFPLSCGESAWVALPKIRELLDGARRNSIPVLYTRQAPRSNAVEAGQWAAKNSRVFEVPDDPNSIANQIPEMIAPWPSERVIDKDKPSAFFGTPILSYLIALGVDSLIVAGTSTSGCVRATVVDGFSLNFRMLVAEDGCFDRGEASHKVNLFDMHAKYADVLPIAEILALLDRP